MVEDALQEVVAIRSVVGCYRNGDTIRTDQYRFTKYMGAKANFLDRMLYDHKVDPGEDVNVSERGENKSLIDALSKEVAPRAVTSVRE